MNRQKKLSISIVLLIVIFTSGCAKLLGGLRRDLDDTPSYDQPTTGGSWPEGGLLNEPYRDQGYRYVGHGEQPPPRSDFNRSYYQENGSWISPEQQEANNRNAYRGHLSYSHTPNYNPAVRRDFQSRARASDFRDESQVEGSLWASNGQTNYFFTKNRIRTKGDILTLTMEEKFVGDVAAELKRNLSESEREMELEIAQEKLKKKAVEEQAAAAGGGRAPAGDAAAKPVDPDDIEVRDATYGDIDLKDAIDMKPNDTMMVEILERYPNGNYKIRGTKRLNYRGKVRNLNMVGVIKHAEVSDDDKIASSKIYEYQMRTYR